MKNVKGFSLIELMIVVAIIGIIASFAVASYNDSVIKTKRADAKATLMDLSARFERCYTANGQYKSTTGTTTPLVPDKMCDLVSTGDVLNVVISNKGYYDISLPTITADSFVLTATPRSGSASNAFADPKCTTFSLSNTGAKTSTPTGSVCW